jgi:hypothetical protein
VHIDAREENVVMVEVQSSTEVQALIEAQLRAMEIKMCESNATAKRKCTIIDKTTLLEKDIHILDLE